MKPVVLYSKVAPDGTVTVQLPIEYAGIEVTVTIQTLSSMHKMTPAERQQRYEDLAELLDGRDDTDDGSS